MQCTMGKGKVQAVFDALAPHVGAKRVWGGTLNNQAGTAPMWWAAIHLNFNTAINTANPGSKAFSKEFLVPKIPLFPL